MGAKCATRSASRRASDLCGAPLDDGIGDRLAGRAQFGDDGFDEVLGGFRLPTAGAAYETHARASTRAASGQEAERAGAESTTPLSVSMKIRRVPGAPGRAFT